MLYKVVIVVTNSVNDDEGITTKLVESYTRAEAIVEEKQNDIDAWNAPDPLGGKMSVRYLDSEIIPLDDNVEIVGFTVGMLIQVIKELNNVKN